MDQDKECPFLGVDCEDCRIYEEKTKLCGIVSAFITLSNAINALIGIYDLKQAIQGDLKK